MTTRILITLFLAMLLSSAWADRVVLTDGREVRGFISSSEGDLVGIATAAGILRLPREKVQSVERSTAETNALLRAEFELRWDDLREAEEYLGKAVALGTADSALRTWFFEHRSLLEDRLNEATASARKPWVDATRRAWGREAANEILVRQSQEPGFTPPEWRNEETSETVEATRYYSRDSATSWTLAMAELFHAAGEGPFALELLESLPPHDLGRAVMEHGFVKSVLLEELRHMLDARDFGRASALVRRMETADLGISDASRILLLLRWTAFERERLAFDAALTVLDQRLKPLSPMLARERMRATLAEARRDLTRACRFSDAVEIYRKWGNKVLVRNTQDTQAELYREWALVVMNENPAEARDALRESFRLTPPEPDEKKQLLDRVEFAERYLALAPDDYASAFELGQWAAENDLPVEGIRAFHCAREHPALYGPSEEQIFLLRKRMSLARLQKCVDLYEAGEPERALAEMDELQDLHRMPEVQTRYSQLRDLCIAEINRRSRIDMAQAEILFQDAQRRFYLGEFQSVRKDLITIRDQFSNTPAARKAEDFLETIEAREALQWLEGEKGETPNDLPSEPDSEVEKELKKVIETIRE